MSWMQTSWGKETTIKKRQFRILRHEFEWRDDYYTIEEFKTSPDNKVSNWVAHISTGMDTAKCYDTLEEAKTVLDKLERIKSVGATTVVFERDIIIEEKV